MKNSTYRYLIFYHFVFLLCFRTFIRTFNSVYGNCYTFNAGNGKHVFKQSQTGPRYGKDKIS